MLFIVCLDEILQDGTGFKDVEFFTIRERAIGDRRDAAIGIDGSEPWFFLDSGGDVDFLDGVWEAELLEGYGDFDTVGSLRGVERD